MTQLINAPTEQDATPPDEMYRKAVSLVLRERKASASLVQRHLIVGYNKAAGLIERMEKEGIVSAADFCGRRTVLKDKS